MRPRLLPCMVSNSFSLLRGASRCPANRPGGQSPADSFSPSQNGKLGPVILAVPVVIAPVFMSKLSAKDATPDRAEDIPMVDPRENGKVISTVSLLTSCLYTLVPLPPATYFAPVEDPVPDTFDRSKTRMTAGGRLNLLVSSTSSLETCARPENFTLSGCPLTMPETGIRATVGAKAARAGVPAHQASPDRTTTKSDSTTGVTDNRSVFMIRSFSIVHLRK